MNIQSSSGSQSTSAAKATVEPVRHTQSESIVKMLSTSKEMKKAEIQGVRISVGEEQLVKAIDRAIKALEGPQTSFEMKVHKQTNTIIVKVFNKETGDLIREIPPEKTLDLVVKMMEFAGILIDEKV